MPNIDYFIETASLDNLQTECLLVGVYENQVLTPSASQVDRLTQGLITRLMARGDLKGKLGETLWVSHTGSEALKRILLVGLGEKKTLARKQYRKVVASAAKLLRDAKMASACTALLDVAVEKADAVWCARQIVEGVHDAFYQYSATKTIDEAVALRSLSLYADASSQALAEQGVVQGVAIAKGVELAKSLADLPGNICTPSYLASQAIELAGLHAQLNCEILEEQDLEVLGMGSFLAVSRGSRQPAKLICLNYQGGVPNQKPVVLVGKGLTFDAGGISLKPGLGMDEMKYDMCGGASVLGAIRAAIDLNLKLNIVGLIPASENLPDGDANKPGDILTSMSGKTIEILNTDAEGRLILCDTLTYAKRFDPEVVVDMATLTGACIVALGRVPSGLFGNDDALCQDLEEAAEEACDAVWRMPIWDEYQDQLKSNFADYANIGGPDGGSITAACFLSNFAKEFKWAHLDIAGTAWRTGAAKGATGRPVPLISQFLLNRAG